MASELVEVVNGKVRLNPHKGQSRAWYSERRFVLMLAGSQGGKTSFEPWWLWREMQRQGPGDYLAVTASYDLFKLKFLPEMRRVFEGLLHWGTFSAGDMVIVSNDKQTRIILRSAQAPGGLESGTVKAAVLDECGQDGFRMDAWEAIQRRLSLAQGRVLGGTTPYNLGWLKQQWYDRWAAGDADYDVIQFESIANPQFPAEEFERMKRTLPAWKFNMFYRGLYSRPAGLIYEDYDEAAHCVEPFPIPRAWPRYVGIDFGAVHTALVWIAEDVNHDAYYVYRESLEGGKTTGEHAAQALTHAARERVVGWYGGAAPETQQRMDWSAAGVPVQGPRVVDVEAGIDRIIGLFKRKQLFVFNTCAGLRDELGTYARQLDANGQVTEKIKDKEDFHRIDALRYAAQWLNVGDIIASVSSGRIDW